MTTLDERTSPPQTRETAQPPAKPAKDPRVAALRRFAMSITAFTIAGHAILGFEQAYLTPVVGVLTAYVCELILESLEAWVQRRRPRYLGSPRVVIEFLLPAHISGLACAMLLYGNEQLWPTMFAATVAVASKYIVRVKLGGRMRHVLNPSNIGISLTLILFGWVGIAPPYEFTENVTGVVDWIVPAAIVVLGTMLNAKLTGKMPLIAAWVGGFALQAVVRAVVLGHALIPALFPMTGVAFVLFTNYMITDPATSPMKPRRQVVFGLATAATYGLLVASHITFGLFYALSLVCILRMFVIIAANQRQRWLARPRVPVPAPSTKAVPARSV